MSDRKCADCDKPGVWWIDCSYCEEGMSHHDCGEDCCCCLAPVPNMVCELCKGNGGWRLCDEHSRECEEAQFVG